MQKQQLEGCRVLIVEDEYLIADDMREALVTLGADVVGPVGTVDAAAALIADETLIDLAILDINLGGKPVFGIADLLVERSIPFAFATGYDRQSIPNRFTDIARLEKPVKSREIGDAVDMLIAGRTTDRP